MKKESMKRGRTMTTVRSIFRLALALGLTVGGANLALAQSGEAQAPVARSEVGHATLSWLDLQRSNAQAAPATPMLGAEAGLAYRRYLESFKSKIPDLYQSALGSGGSQSGSGSGTGSH
ncbi:DUF3613 domain-containing protein [Paraburkholderia sp. BCC1886]|uniref:DUF3613 domain-containing protein n=1 Tax=Paraburkholderia sp. BCC1886 TaxID=2562670 RepID=UPI0021B188AA|nr:DUF3613 domain-containing protein [Paraburkholderia sp. BCC1886]